MPFFFSAKQKRCILFLSPSVTYSSINFISSMSFFIVFLCSFVQTECKREHGTKKLFTFEIQGGTELFSLVCKKE